MAQELAEIQDLLEKREKYITQLRQELGLLSAEELRTGYLKVYIYKGLSTYYVMLI